MMQFRKKELRYLYDNFLRYSGIDVPQADDYDKLCFYFDAFLFCAVAASETKDKKTSRLFYKIMTFPYIKALRNISAHYGAPHIIRDGKSSPFFTRLINETYGPLDNKIELRINIESSIKEIDDANTKYKNEHNGEDNGAYKSAITYLESIKGESKLIHDIFGCFMDDFSIIADKAQHRP